MTEIPMPGTAKADFLQLAPFIYPITPLPEVTWDNAEVLLVEGRKWDMPVVIEHVGKFICSNTSKLNKDPASSLFAWKWLQLADAAGQQRACEACISEISKWGRYCAEDCTADCLQALSPKTLHQLVQRLANRAPDGTNYCSSCEGNMEFACQTGSLRVKQGVGMCIDCGCRL